MTKQSSISPEGSMGHGLIMHAKNSTAKLGLNYGNQVIDSWVNLTKASSSNPSVTCSTLDYNATDHAYSFWMRQYPSALRNFENIMAGAKGKTIALFLDYDGTLSPIVTDPDHAFMSDSMRAAVKEVAKLFPTAIVSGRGRDKVYNFVKLNELYYAGSHGMDIKGPSRTSKHTKSHAKLVQFQPASEFLTMIDEVSSKLVEKIKTVAGSKVENNKFCLSVHFRCVDEKEWSTLADLVKFVLRDYPKLHLTQGRKVLEIRPSIKWDKGKALEFLLGSFGFADCKDVFPIYIGDDRTDEDAFKVLREKRQGFGILVSKTPKETTASYSLQEPAEVMDFLHHLVDWKRALKCDSRK